MKTQDIDAICAMNTRNNVYLAVVKRDGQEQLMAVTKRNCLSRFWMRTGLSSASMNRVIKYVNRENLLAQHSGINGAKLRILKEKIDRFRANLLINRIYSVINRICTKVYSILFFRQRARALQGLDEKFHKSTPVPPENLGLELRHTFFLKECKRLQLYLEMHASPSHKITEDLLYICIGHNGVQEQIWPGFLLNYLQRGKTVQMLLFERMCGRYPDVGVKASEDLQAAYANYPLNNGKLYDHLNAVFVSQFLCALPCNKEKALDELDLTTRQCYEPGGPLYQAHHYWLSQKDTLAVRDNFNLYIEKVLKAGKQVVIGDHRGPIFPSDSLIATYNTLIKKYPNQLHFLWGWEKRNWMTNQPILTEEDCHPLERSSIWQDYPTGLNRCEI